jgi:hypothetical protein
LSPDRWITVVVRVIGAIALTGGFSDVCRAGQGPTTCVTCHRQQAETFAHSVHAELSCQQCHGGSDSYDLPPDELNKYLSASGSAAPAFEHGPSFRGKPDRSEIPEACGTCHADVERMNPYGLHTDQLARYWTSGHGKTLKNTGDQRVAVCVDCHGTHGVLPASNPDSRTHPFNVPDTCATCHDKPTLMAEFGLAREVVDEYRRSVHGRLLIGQHDTGAPTCATCHGNHSAMPPGFATVGAVCGQCHEHSEKYFAETIHAEQLEHKACLICHGGGEGRHFHLIERMSHPAGLMIQRYASLLESEPDPSPEQITEAIHPEPKRIMTRALAVCTECHEEPDEDESLPMLFALLTQIDEAERYYVKTARRLDETARGVLLVKNQRFKFEDAKTHLIEFAPMQHSLDQQRLAEKAAELRQVCDQVNAELDDLERGLRWRYWALIPVWVFALAFAAVLYAKYRQLNAAYVKPLPG